MENEKNLDSENLEGEILDPENLIGKVISERGRKGYKIGYKIEQKLGSSKKSVVYKAKDLGLGRWVALKALKSGLEEKREKQFEEEGKKLASLEASLEEYSDILDHPNIMRVYSSGEDKGIKYITMTLIDGFTLKQENESGKKYSMKEVLNVFSDVTDAASYAYNKKIPHGDIKPSNIMIKGNGTKTLKYNFIDWWKALLGIKEIPHRTYLVDLGGTINEEHNDVEEIGKITRNLLNNRENPNEKIPRKLDYIVSNAEKRIYENPEKLRIALEKYKNGITRRKLLAASILSSPLWIGGGLMIAAGFNSLAKRFYEYAEYRRNIIEQEREYKLSINFVIDKLSEESNPEKIEPILGELELRLLNQKVRKQILEGIIPKGKFAYAVPDHNSEWALTDGSKWTSGFTPGLAWLAYKKTGDDKFKQLAYEWLNEMKFTDIDRFYLNPIRFYYSHALGYDITGDEKLRDTALIAAEKIADLFNENSGFIINNPVLSGRNQIYTNVMMRGIPLLCWSYEQNLDESSKNKIISHCNATIKYNVNNDGSTRKFSRFDSSTKEPIISESSKGNSCLSEYQAMAIKGFISAYNALKEENFLETAVKCADFFISNLSEDNIPYYSLKDPIEFTKNSAAGAIGASGLLDLFYSSNNEKYKSKALEILKSLSTNYLSRENKYEGFLMHASAVKNDSSIIDGSLIYGDYYFLESLSKI